MPRRPSSSTDALAPPAIRNQAASPPSRSLSVDSKKLQPAFFAAMGGPQQFHRLFDHLPGVYFFVKDRQGRLICASPSFCEHLGARSEAELIGRTDDEFFPRHAADHFRRDDERVMSTGEPLIGRVELWYTEHGVLDWFITNKHPVRDTRGNVIGVMGIVRSYEGQRRSMQPMSLINATIDYIRAHQSERLTVRELAAQAGLSQRHLHRKFREVFGLSVREFLAKTRIQAAGEALVRTDQRIAQVAIDFGFCDQSAFTQLFRKHTGLTPRQFRVRYQSRDNGCKLANPAPTVVD